MSPDSSPRRATGQITLYAIVLYAIVLYAITFLFFFQLIADFVEAIYAFGLLGTSIPPEIAAVLFLFAPVLLLLWPDGRRSRLLLRASGLLMLASRVVEVMLDTRGRMIFSGIGVGSFLIFLPVLLWRQSQEGETSAGPKLTAGLTLGVSASVLLRAWGSGSDISSMGMFKLVGWLLATIAAFLLFKVSQSAAEVRSQPAGDHATLKTKARLNTMGQALGLTAVLVLLYFAFTSPNVVARWTGASYLLVEIAVLLALSLLAILLVKPLFLSALSRPALLWPGNLLFVLSVAWTIWPHQVHFPADPYAYSLAEPAAAAWHNIPLLIMLLTFPIIIVDFMLFSRELLAGRPEWRTLAISFTAGSLFLLVMVLAQVFTTVYDYIPVIGPSFRDKFWLVAATPGLLLLLALGISGRRELEWAPFSPGWFPAVVSLMGVMTIAGVLVTSSRPQDQAAGRRALRLLTYNIQQGYNETGLKNFDGQLRLIRQVDADVIGLQESDTNRIAGGNSDVVRYFADRLNLYAYYGPKVVPGTFGIALLSKYPIENPRTFYMYSAGEQTATIEAEIKVDGQVFHIFVTHLGNGGPIVQQEAILGEVTGKGNVILMGDFNFRPGTEQYELTTRQLADAWLLRWPEGIDDQGVNPDRRIDHIFVSPGTAVKDIRYLLSPESDHPAVTAFLEW